MPAQMFSVVDYTIYLFVAAVIIAFFLFKRLSFVGVEAAQACLRQGAKIIDVRTEAEYQQRHLDGAISLPLDRLREEIARHAPDKSQPLLLHCLSGGRSGLGAGMLKRMGYQRVFNLGSYARARRIVDSTKP